MAALEPQRIEKIVVRGTNWVGDALMTVPALRALRKLLPEAHITLATRSWTAGVFRDVDFLDEFLVCEARGIGGVLKQVRDWRRGQFDLALLFQNAFEAALVAALAQIPYRVGYATDSRRLLLTHPISAPEWKNSRHEIFYYLNIVSELGRLMDRSIGQEVDSSLEVDSARREAALSLLNQNGIRGQTLVALCPGSINSRAKRWPADRYAVLGDLLIEKLDAEVILVGSPDELNVSHEVRQQMRHEPIVLTGKTDLEQLCALLSVVDLVITNDTGAAHIAAAFGRPVLVIFGPTNPLTTRPYSKLAETLRHPPECAPCMLRDCPIDHRCMTAISPEEVFAKAREMINPQITQITKTDSRG